MLGSQLMTPLIALRAVTQMLFRGRGGVSFVAGSEI